MKKISIRLIAILMCCSLSTLLSAQEVTNSTNSMIPLPLRINFNGMLMWGYNLDFNGHTMHHGSMSDHSNMGDSHMTNSHMNNDNMGSSDMNHGNMNDMDDTHTNNHDSQMSMDQEWMYAVMPMISLGGDKFTNIINLNKAQTNDISWESNSSNLVVAQNKNYKVGAGLGVMAMPPVDIPLFSLKLNLMPYKGGHTYKLKHIDSKKDKFLIETMKIPSNLSDLRDWKINDQISYSSSGGVMFGAGAGMSILVSAMKMYMAEGNWLTTVKKVDQTLLMVSLRKSKIKMLSTNVGNMLVQVSKGKMKTTDQYFNFVYDLSEPIAVKAYKRLIKGDVLYTQNLILDGNKSIEMVKKSNSIILGESSKLTTGIPFLFNSQNAKGEMVNTSFVHNGYTGSKVKTYMGMYKKTHTTDGILSNRKNGGVIFMGMTTQKQKSRVFKPRYSGAFKWFYSKQDVKRKTFKKKLMKAAKTLGIDKVKSLYIPEMKDLGYLKVELDLAMNKKEVDQLIESKQKFSDEETKRVIENYFSNREKLKDYCKIDTLLKTCRRRVIKTTQKTLKKIKPIITKMKIAIVNKNLENFNTSFTKLGKLALTNRFVLAEVMRKAGKKSLKATINIEGTNIQRYKNILEGEL